jgi:hypothetical protein
MKVLLQKRTSSLSGDHNHLLMRPVHPQGTQLGLNRLPSSIWVEFVLGLISTALLGLTILFPDWIEVLSGLAPDTGDGSTEWGLALSLATVSLLMFGFAGRSWRKHIQRLQPAPGN